MDPQEFSYSKFIKAGWQATKSNFWLLVPMAIILTVVSYVPGFLAENNESLVLLFTLLSWALQLIITLGVMSVSLKVARGAHADWGTAWADVRTYFWRYCAATILYILKVGVGLLLFIVPGIIWSIKHQYYTLAMLDKDLGAYAALQESGRITQGKKGDVFLFGIVLGFLGLLGFLVFFVGIFVAMPVTWIAYTFFYLALQKRAEQFPVNTTPNNTVQGNAAEAAAPVALEGALSDNDSGNDSD